MEIGNRTKATCISSLIVTISGAVIITLYWFSEESIMGLGRFLFAYTGSLFLSLFVITSFSLFVLRYVPRDGFETSIPGKIIASILTIIIFFMLPLFYIFFGVLSGGWFYWTTVIDLFIFLIACPTVIFMTPWIESKFDSEVEVESTPTEGPGLTAPEAETPITDEASSSAKFCNQCGAPRQGEAGFCTECGSVI